MVSLCNPGRLEMTSQQENVVNTTNHVRGSSLYELLEAENEHFEKLQSEKQQAEKHQPEKHHVEKQQHEKHHVKTQELDKHHVEKHQLEKQQPEKSSRTFKSKKEKSGPQKKLEQLLSLTGNKHCADCGSPDPKWVSMGAGVFICIKCSGVHRSLGAHITKVYSVKLDEWTEDQVSMLAETGGNIVVNKKYEACMPLNIKKPRPDSCIEERSDFIWRKYELQQFLNSDENMSCPFPRPTASSTYQSHSRIGHAFRNSWKRKEESKGSKKGDTAPGMIEFVGLIKVNVVRGTNLAVRDMVSSDPYVILSLGGQSVKTRVIKNNLNPVWNEKLMLSIPDCIPPLKLLVYDKDTFTTDDFMGQAEIDIQPLVSAAKAYERSTLNEPTQLGKWVASKDNTLVSDSIISLVEGTVKQQMSIRLQNVERGVLDLELECVPLTQ